MVKKLQKDIYGHFIDKEVVNMYSEMEKRYFIHNSIAMYDKKYLAKNPFDEHLPGKDRYWAMMSKKEDLLYDPKWKRHHYTEKGNTWKGLVKKN